MKVLVVTVLLLAGFAFSSYKTGDTENWHDTDFSKIRGRFILNGASCAGFEFFSNKEVIWRNEITCADPDTMLLHWLDEKSFLMKDKRRANANKDCAPRNWHYTVSKFDGQNLVLQELWTGWGDYKKEDLKFSLKKR